MLVNGMYDVSAEWSGPVRWRRALLRLWTKAAAVLEAAMAGEP